MKKIILVFLFFAGVATEGQVPTKLFDVRNGNGMVDGANTYSRATYIVFKDDAAKSAVIDAFADAYGYQATIDGEANPQSKQAFFNQQLTRFVKDVYRAQKVAVAAKSAGSTAATAAELELP